MRAPVRLFVLAALPFTIAACETADISDVILVSIPRDVQSFLVQAGPTPIRGYEQPLVDSTRNIILFRVTYGGLTCAETCSYPRALGLKYGDRIGWVTLPAGKTSGLFDVTSADSYLMSEDFLEAVRIADAGAHDAVRLWLARDPDTNAAAL